MPVYAFRCTCGAPGRTEWLAHDHTIAEYPLCHECGCTLTKDYRSVQVAASATPVGRNPYAPPEGRRNAYEQSPVLMPGAGGEMLPVIDKSGWPMTVKQRQNMGSKFDEAVRTMRAGTI
jgi:hypothetical protein